MMRLSFSQLAKVAQHAKAQGRLDAWYPPLASALDEFGIDTQESIAQTVATFLEETGEFRAIEENLNYGVYGLMKTWPTLFPSEDFARMYAGRPEAIANRAYGNRMGNGPEQSGDGWLNRGRGLIQITGTINYRRSLNGLGRKDGDRDYLLTPEGASRSGCWFVRHGVLNYRTGSEIDLKEIADRGDFLTFSVYVNGANPPLNWGLRQDYYTKLKAALVDDVLASIEVPLPKPSTPRAMRTGYIGADVADLQSRLAKLGYDIAVDSHYGEQTRFAVTDFQIKQRIGVDGVAGPETMARLRILTT